MILTGKDIHREVRAGRIHIDDFDPERLEPNSYGFRLSDQLIWYDREILDCLEPAPVVRQTIGADGFVFEPGRLYLGSTMEAMGSPHYAATLYARRSISTLGVWIQFSAPLGHSGAIFPWTLGIAVAAPVRLFAGMVIGKLAFWAMHGRPREYGGKYLGSRSVVASRISLDQRPGPAVPDGGRR